MAEKYPKLSMRVDDETQTEMQQMAAALGFRSVAQYLIALHERAEVLYHEGKIRRQPSIAIDAGADDTFVQDAEYVDIED